MTAEEVPATRCGTIALVGNPNAGKSSLLNALVGEPLSIVSPRPQATRAPVVGIWTEGDTQLVFIDSPGLLEPRYLLQQAMREAALGVLRGVHAILHLIPVNEPVVDLRELVPELGMIECPILVVRTKCDTMPAGTTEPPGDLAVSVRTRAGLHDLVAWCRARVPVAPFRYDPDELSTQPVRFFAAEYVREAAFALLGEELPYALAVEIDEYREATDPVYIRALLLVERESQKRMVIGKGGRMIKQLGEAARSRIEELLGQRVYLDLWVKVLPRWRSKAGALARFGLPVTERTSR